MSPGIGPISDAALHALRESADRIEGIATRMLASSEREELLWLADTMRRRGEERAGINEITSASRLVHP